jgi:uncharacterized protein (DUF427 family)
MKARCDRATTSRASTCTCTSSNRPTSYWSFVTDDGTRHDDIVWSYEEPIDGMEAIAGRLCFYDERVTLLTE